MKNIKLENLAAVEQGIKQAVKIIGSLVWYTVTDVRMTRDQLRDGFTKAGIDEKYMPKPINYRDAFRRATKYGEVKRLKLAEDKYLNIMIRDVKSTPDFVLREMVREVVNEKDEQLEYLPVATLRHDSNGIVTIPRVDLLPEEREARNTIEKQYEIEKENYNGRCIREIAMDILRECRPVSVRPSGGVYFVPEKFSPVVDSLKEFVNSTTDYSVTSYKSRMYSIDVLDTDEYRQMVEDNLEDQIKAESEALVKEMVDIFESDKTVTQAAAQKYIERVQNLDSLVANYEDMLQTQVVSAQANVKLAMQQAMALLKQKVKVA